MIRGEQNVVVAIKYCDELDVGDMLYEKGICCKSNIFVFDFFFKWQVYKCVRL